MQRFLLVLSFAIAACCAMAPEGRAEATRTPAYENGETLFINSSEGEKVVAKANSKLRNFLWKHWASRTRARILVKGSTTEGLPWSQSFLIEPDENGVWIIAVRFEGDSLGPEGKTAHELAQYKAYQVIRTGARTNRYRLILKDRNGTVRAEI